jgi:FtsZ-binding cell division protein ZapB
VEENVGFEAQLNASLDDVIELLQREIERLKESLETYRLSKHPDRVDIIRWHVHTLDERQDALEDVQAMLLEKVRPMEVH